MIRVPGHDPIVFDINTEKTEKSEFSGGETWLDRMASLYWKLLNVFKPIKCEVSISVAQA